ncbi:hypothetical protein P5V15_009997 [Pogonomyrmex californicus]
MSITTSDNNEHIKMIESPFPRHFHFQTEDTVTTSFTKMNIITPVISKPARNIMDLIMLVTGASLNVFLGLSITLNSIMHTSSNCYVMSLMFSNFVVLLEPLKQVFDWIFDIHLEMNLDYVFMMSFSTSILIIILLNVETYVVICQKNSPLRNTLLKISTAIKGVSFIWILCIMLIAMELHLYDHFQKEIMHDIYISSSVMFLIFPSFILILLNYFTLYDLIISKSIIGAWPSEDIKRFIFLVGVNVGFFLTMVPYRIVRIIIFITQSYNDMAIEITYIMIKMHPTILPIICFITLKRTRQTFKDNDALSTA